MSGWRAALVAAIVGGVVLVVGYVVGRPATDGGTTTTSLPETAVEVRLVCAPSLQAVCETLAAGFGGTASELRPGQRIPGEAVVLAPRSDLPEGLTVGAVIGRTPVAIAVWSERSGVLSRHCRGSVDAACLAGAYGEDWTDLEGSESWGPFKVGLADPNAGGGELASWQAVGPEVDGLSSSLRVRARNESDLVGQLAQFGPARMDVVVATEVALAAQLENVKDIGRLELFYPDPGPWVEIVVAWSGSGQELEAALLTPEAQAAMATAGLRPAVGETAGLPAEFGAPGQALPAIDDQTRSTLLAGWAALGT